MSTLTQRIPNLFLGISQQPDSRKFPGQVKEAINTFPDYALGMLKRPGGEHVTTLLNGTTDGKWFSILRDAEEKYVAQWTGNEFRIWNLLDGAPRRVNMGSASPGSCVQADLDTKLNDYNNAVQTRKTRLSELNTAQAAYAEVLAGQEETITGQFEVTYNYPEGGVDAYVKSGIILNPDGDYQVLVDGTIVFQGPVIPSTYKKGSEVTNEQPLLARDGVRLFQVGIKAAAVNTEAELTAAQADMDAAQTAYDAAVQDEATKLADYEAELANCTITSLPNTNYLYGASADDIELLTINDYTFVLNKNKFVEMDSTLTPALPNEAFVVINVVSYNAKYTVVLNGTAFTHQTPATTAAGVADAESIASALASSINANANFSATRVGAGIYISSTADFTLETRGSTEEDGLYGFKDSIGTTSRLPTQGKNGYKVRVVNSADIDVDDMWVEFTTSGGGTYGSGTWTESNAPELKYRFNKDTMPHQLVREADGSFTFGPVEWDDRLIGDDETNPEPTFVGNKINNMFLYRNRFGFLSGGTVILSRAGDYFNFFATTALTGTDDDPIDIDASSTKAITLNYVQPTAVGLILFAETDQFLLATDSDIMSPKTAKINTLSSYECDAQVEAVSIGTSVALISKTPLYTRLFDLTDIRTDAPPIMEELTNNVPELIPSSIDDAVSSPALSLISVGQKGSDTLYQYRFLQQRQRRVQSWYKWKLTGNLLHQFFDLSTYYVVVSNGDEISVQSVNLTQASEEGFLTLPSGEKTDVCLDQFENNPYRTYDESADTTRVFLPYAHAEGKTFTVMALGGYIGASNQVSSQSVGAVLYPDVETLNGQDYVDIDGDYRGRDLIIGYVYEMNMSLPKLFLTKNEEGGVVSDDTSDLVIHRLKVNTGLSGPITYRVKLAGITEFENVVVVTQPGTYTLNNVNLSAGDIHTLPIYQRNKNIESIEIVGDTPFPVSLLNLTWEGKYNTRFYQRL